MAKLRKYPTKSGYVYAVDFYFLGKRHIKSTKTSNYRLAKKIMQDIEGKIARGIFKLEEYKEKHSYLSPFLAEYFKSVEFTKSPNTLYLEKVITNTFRKCIGDIDLRSIEKKDLDTWKSRRLASIKPATFNIELRTLHAIINVAKSWGYVNLNPFNDIKKVKEEEKRLYMTSSELQRFFEELARFFQSARRKTRKEKVALLGPFYEFLLNTGLRREEAVALTLNDIDYEHNLILIPKTKDKEARAVPLTERARAILDSLGSSVFSRLTKSYVTHNFTKICKAAGLKGFKLHSLRHTFATRLIDHGVDVLTVSKILGHSDITTTMIYAKVRVETLKNAIASLERGKLPVRKWYIEGRKEDVDKIDDEKVVQISSNSCARDRT